MEKITENYIETFEWSFDKMAKLNKVSISIEELKNNVIPKEWLTRFKSTSDHFYPKTNIRINKHSLSDTIAVRDNFNSTLNDKKITFDKKLIEINKNVEHLIDTELTISDFKVIRTRAKKLSNSNVVSVPENVVASFAQLKNDEYSSLLSRVGKLLSDGFSQFGNFFIEVPKQRQNLSFRDLFEEIVEDLDEIQELDKLVNSLNNRISYLIRTALKKTRDLRNIFTKNHSFHFKNLDDYHSSDLNYHLRLGFE